MNFFSGQKLLTVVATASDVGESHNRPVSPWLTCLGAHAVAAAADGGGGGAGDSLDTMEH